MNLSSKAGGVSDDNMASKVKQQTELDRDKINRVPVKTGKCGR